MNQPTSKWVNTEPDAGAPHALLERLSVRVPIEAIEELWMFPARRLAAAESTVFLVAALGADAEQRRVITARYTVTRDRKGSATVQEQLDEHGIAPPAAITRIVNGVLQRLDQEGEQPPRTEAIERDPERWWALVEELGGKRPPPASPASPDSDRAPPAAESADPAAAPQSPAPADSDRAPAAAAPQSPAPADSDRAPAAAAPGNAADDADGATRGGSATAQVPAPARTDSADVPESD